MIDGIEVVRHPRARRMRLSVDPASGLVRLTLPPRGSKRDGLAWALTKSAWIEAQRARLPRALPFVPGAVIPFGDGELTLVWRAGAARTPVREDNRLVIGGPAERFGDRVERWLRREALRVLTEETLSVAGQANVSIERVAIGDPRARWGSCSAGGAIRYSWRLILAPDRVRRFVVAHEVAHRRHMNHGPAFHALERELLGADPRPAMTWLRRHGAGLHWLGKSPA
ncbi:metal-dependent hydrolase [Sphingomonas spermidinifaciens]|uniref:Metal-dependent hydrolase n=1 Tax=Sphingomonas spermidinifaciens TaxID=1141889 RepID=A0A2A4B8X8_9SPHN|nr:SprT family zinc-dependent metalloprotease [Sphingomonas spermidinifaciens]PCD04520.1 metal-dependent hydrolase [Sphingomonas spermidinifaciens]